MVGAGRDVGSGNGVGDGGDVGSGEGVSIGLLGGSQTMVGAWAEARRDGGCQPKDR